MVDDVEVVGLGSLKTYGIESIAKVLAMTGQLSKSKNAGRR